MASLKRSVDGYLRHLTIERGMAKNTLLAYKRDLGKYLEALEKMGITDSAEITEIVVRNFAQSLVSEKRVSCYLGCKNLGSCQRLP